MIKITENGPVQLGTPRKMLSEEDQQEIARMFSFYEAGSFGYTTEADKPEDDTTVFEYGGMEGRCCPRF